MSKIIVVGANHAGTYAIKTILQNFKDTIEVTTYDRNNNISFLGCGMALWISNVITSSEGLFYSSPEELKELGANVYMDHEMMEVDFDKKKITLKNVITGESVEDSYDKLILAIGSWPILPKLKGHDLENIMYAKIFQNAEDVIEKIKDESIQNVVVVGAGYIGVELAEAFKMRGKKTTLINDYEVLNRYYDEPFQKRMHDKLVENGIDLRIGERVTEFEGKDGKVTTVITEKGSYKADLVLMCIGFKPRTHMLEGKIEMYGNGAIKTNKKLETSVKDVYAIGDCGMMYNNAVEDYTHIALATNAVRSGIVAGLNAGGADIEMLGVQGSNAIHIFGDTLCSTGITEGEAKRLGYNVNSVEVTDTIKADFMPENDEVTLKIVWDKDSRRILGAQMASTTDITLALHFFSLAVQEHYSIDKLALTDLFFLPHFNKPENFITKAGLLGLGK